MAVSFPSISILDAVQHLDEKEVAMGLQNFQFQLHNIETLKWAKNVSQLSAAPTEIELLFRESQIYNKNRYWHGLVNNRAAWLSSANNLTFGTVPDLVYQGNPINVSTPLVSKATISKNVLLRLAHSNPDIRSLGTKLFADAMYMMWKTLLEKYNNLIENTLPTLISTNGGFAQNILPTVSGDYRVVPVAQRDKFYEALRHTARKNYMNEKELALLFNTELDYDTDIFYESKEENQDTWKSKFSRAFGYTGFSNTLPIVGSYGTGYMAQRGTLGVFEFTHQTDAGELFDIADRSWLKVQTPAFMKDAPIINATLLINKRSVDNSGVYAPIVEEFREDTVIELALIMYPSLISAATPDPDFKGIIGFAFDN